MTTIAFVLLTVLGAPGHANDDDAARCEMLTKYMTSLIEAGQLARAERLRPEMAQCLPAQRDAIDRHAKRIQRRREQPRRTIGRTDI